MMNEIDLSRVDLNLLVLFDAVLQERHVGRAADRLNLSPSAVSHGLGRLRRLLNDPLFVRTPKGVVATDRALALSPPIADVLSRLRSVLATAEPFDPATSTRRFIIGAPDGVSAVFLPALLAELRAHAPGIDISLRQLLPLAGERSSERAWRGAFTELEARALDVAIVPTDLIPPRFHQSLLYEEDFVVAMRSGHPSAARLTLERYCAARHLVVSLTGEADGFVDTILEQHGRKRRVALTVPNFMMALATLAETDLLAALPHRFAATYAARFGVVWRPPPMPLEHSRLTAVAPAAAMRDAGLAWLLDKLGKASNTQRASARGRNRQPSK
jgi:DNA-binding transcriptional LysR family regulator